MPHIGFVAFFWWIADGPIRDLIIPLRYLPARTFDLTAHDFIGMVIAMTAVRLSLDQANLIVAGALDRGGALNFKPLTVAVLDAGGHLIAFQRQDGASNLRPQIAFGKAFGALSLGVSSRAIATMAAERPSFVASLGQLSPHGIVPAAGGVLIADADGAILGAVGVTGDTSDNDEICALAGLEAAGFTALP
jgi:uncharacterized protein GlcG (DUF336 family)